MARNDEHQSLSEVLKSFVNENRLQKGLDKVNVMKNKPFSFFSNGKGLYCSNRNVFTL